MNLLDSIDKSAYTLLFPDETEMSPNSYSSTAISSGGGVGLRGTGHNGTGNRLNPPPRHTILNMKTTLVNGRYDMNCDKCDSSSDLEYDEKRPLVQSEVIHGVSPRKSSADLGTTTSHHISSSHCIIPPNQNFLLGSGETLQMNSTGHYNIELISAPLTLPTTAVDSVLDGQHINHSTLYNNGEMSTIPKLEESTANTNPSWGPNTNFISSNNLSNNSSCPVNFYSEGQKILPSTYFLSDYTDIFGNIANYDETDDVAKLPITSEENNKMFLIGLSSNNENDEEEEEYDDREITLMDNDDQGSSNSPFHSATEDMAGDGDGSERGGGDQDPLLIRAPPRQNVFHQFIRSAKTSTKNRIMRHGGKISSRNSHLSSSSRDGGSSSSSSGLMKEVSPSEGQEDDGGDSTSIITGSADNRGNGSHCSIGILLAAISCFFFATSALIVKISSLHPMELLAVRGTIQGILVSPIVVSTGNSFLGPRGTRSLLLSRAVLGAVALVMGFASIHLIPLADAATVIFTSPVFVSIFACLCLGEVCSWFDVSMIAMTLVGVLLVSKPSFSFISTGTWTGIVGTICGLIAAMLTALAFIVLRQLKQVHYSVVVFWFSTVLAMFGAVLTVALDGFTFPTSLASILECIGIGFCGFMGQILLTKALQSENALPIAVTRTFDIVLAFFYQITLLHDTPDWYSYLGSVLVVSCVLLTAFHRWYKESTKRKYTRVNKIQDDDENQHESMSSSSSSSLHNQRQTHHLYHPPEEDDEEGNLS